MSNTRSLFERLVLSLVFCAVAGVFFYAAHKIYESRTTTYRAKKILVNHESKNIRKVLFSPDDSIQTVLQGLIDGEKKGISLAIFAFTDSTIAQALIDAAKRGVHVEVIADGDNAQNEYSKIKLLKKYGIPVWIYPSERKGGGHTTKTGIMHNKFIVFHESILGNPVVWSGSYNITRSAHEKNQENVLILDDPEIVERYLQHFDSLKARSILSK